MTALDRDRVRHVAGLARLALTPEEEDRFTRELPEVLAHFESLPETAEEDAALDAPAPALREDRVAAAAEDVRARIVTAFPRRDGDLARVPRGL